MQDIAKLLLRVGVGGLLLLHGVAKLFRGVDPIAQLLTHHALPAWIAYGAYAGEVIAPVAVILGIGSRLAAAVMAFLMCAAVYLAHGSQLLELTRAGGWALELQALYFLASTAIALLGAGRYSLSGGRGRLD